MKPQFLVVKVGGSLFSDKRGSTHLDDRAVARYAAMLARLWRSAPGRVAFVTGGGALGHDAVRVLDHADPFAALRLTEATFRLKWIWTAALRDVGVRAFPVQAAALCADGRDGLVVDDSVLRRLIETGALPVLSGDCVLTAEGRLRVLGSDRIPGILLRPWLPEIRIVTLTDVPGILAGARDSGSVLRYIDPNDPGPAEQMLWSTPAWDTSDGMRGKLAALLDHARRGAECVIMRGTPQPADYLLEPIHKWPADLAYTLISPRRPVSRWQLDPRCTSGADDSHIVSNSGRQI